MPTYIGTNKVKSAYIGTQKVKSIYVGTNKVYSSSRLPSEYQEVEWIGCAGYETNYINTPIKQNNLSKIEMDIMHIADSRYLDSYVCGYFHSSGYRGMINMKSDGTILIYNSDLNVSVNPTTYSDNTKITLVASTNDVGWGASYVPTRIGQAHQYQSGNIRIYSAKVYNRASTIAFDGVPCYNKTSGVIGMYDLISNTFFTNQGTGTFTKGSDV